jgi:mono/diheme cytochrome c family protein
MRRTLFLLALFLAAIANPLVAQSGPSEKNGKVVYDKWCAPCHGAQAPKTGMFASGALPGTLALSLKYQGKLPAVLDQRTDLTPALIKSVVRHGLYGMPITRKTEVSDAELNDVIAYLTRNRKK